MSRQSNRLSLLLHNMTNETNKQLTKEIGDMYQRMRDPMKQDEKNLKDKLKKNVERKKQRTGL